MFLQNVDSGSFVPYRSNRMKILVIGGGMAGLTYAIVAAKNGQDVTVVERNTRVGKKISMTGNGKCNIGNARVTPACFNKSSVANKVLAEISVDEYIKFLQSVGIYVFEDSEGRMYPFCESASNVVDCLRNQVEKYGGKIICDAEVFNVRPVDKGYEVLIDRTNYRFDKVVAACGSKSQANETNVFRVIPKEYFTPLSPSLVPVKTKTIDHVLNGLRAKADVSLMDGAVPIAKESGEVLFKDYGLSGICIFNLSAVIARRIVQGKQGNYKFVLDLLPKFSQWDLEEILYFRLKSGEQPQRLFYGLLHNKIAESIVKSCDNRSDVSKLSYAAKNLSFDFARLLDYSMSQVTAGGIDERYIDLKTLALPNGITALGEMLNVDGVCGGNNLYFAAASALYTFTPEQRSKAYKLI